MINEYCSSLFEKTIMFLDSIIASQTYLSVDQKTDCGSVSMMEDKQYWCEQWVYAHREGCVTEERKYVAKKKCKHNV